MPGIFVLSSGILFVSRRFGHFYRISKLFDRRRRYAPVVTSESLAIFDGKVNAPRLIEGPVRFLGFLGNRTCTCSAERMAT